MLFIQNIFTFFVSLLSLVSLYKELLEPTFLVCLIVLDNLCEDFGCPQITSFISTMSKVGKSW